MTKISSSLQAQVFLFSLLFVGYTAFSEDFKKPLSISSVHEPIVIFDSGQTSPMENYLPIGELQKELNDALANKEKIMEDVLAVQAENLAAIPNLLKIFPFATSGFSVGKVAARKINEPTIVASFFIIGSDKISRAWLTKYADLLQREGAFGLMIEAKTPEDYKTVREMGEGLNIMLAHPPEIIRKLGVMNYPVFVSSTVIWQTPPG